MEDLLADLCKLHESCTEVGEQALDCFGDKLRRPLFIVAMERVSMAQQCLKIAVRDVGKMVTLDQEAKKCH